MRDDKVPVTVLTGFLGSGKTTLLKRILSEQHGMRIAVIENEFGEIGIDDALVIESDEEIFEMNNGCICCTVRGDLIRILGNLMRRRDKFDRILIETTGLADPAPVAQTFFADEDIGKKLRLDGIVTLVDAKHLELHLGHQHEATEQIAFADKILLNKTDLVEPAALDALERRIRGINAVASIHRTQHADVPLAEVLDIGGFDLDRALATKPSFLEPEYPFEWAGAFQLDAGAYTIELDDGPEDHLHLALFALESATGDLGKAAADAAARRWTRHGKHVGPGGLIAPGVSDDDSLLEFHLDAKGTKRFTMMIPAAGRYALALEHSPSEFDLRILDAEGRSVSPLAMFSPDGLHHHHHDDEVTSVGIHLDRPLDYDKLNRWMGQLLQEKGADIFRMKGILDIAGSPLRFVFQGVHMIFDGREDRPWREGETRGSDLVFIGRHLDRAELVAGFESCAA
jgi:G3E family GTPase